MLTVKDAPDFKISKSYVPCTFTDEFKHYSHEADNYTSVILTTGLDQLKRKRKTKIGNKHFFKKKNVTFQIRLECKYINTIV